MWCMLLVNKLLKKVNDKESCTDLNRMFTEQSFDHEFRCELSINHIQGLFVK